MPGPRRIATTVVHTGDRLQSDIQARTRENTEAVNGNPFFGGRIISVNVAASGTYIINHQLGTKARLFMCAVPYGASLGSPQVTEDPDQTGIDANNQTRIYISSGALFDLCFYPAKSTFVPPGKTQAP